MAITAIQGYRATCTEKCRTPVYCAQCKRPKAPVGRDIATAAANGYCKYLECAGYVQDPPTTQHLFPSEWIPADGGEPIKEKP